MRTQKFLENIVFKYPRAVILVTFISIVIMAVLYLPGLEKDSSTNLLPKDHPSVIRLEKLRETFTGTYPQAIILLEAEDTIFNPDTLTRIKKLTEALENIRIFSRDEIEELQELKYLLTSQGQLYLDNFLAAPNRDVSVSLLEKIKTDLEANPHAPADIGNRIEYYKRLLNPLINVVSLANTDNITAKQDLLQVGPIYEEVPQTGPELEIIKEAVMGNEIFTDVLISRDGKYSGIFLEINLTFEESAAMYRLFVKINEIIRRIPGKEKHYMAGFPVTFAYLSYVIDKDMMTLSPVVLLIVVLCLWLMFRVIQGILIPLVVVVMSIVFTLALQAAVGIPINLLSAALPVFLMSIGVADSVHLVSEYLDQRATGHNGKAAVNETMKRLTSPVILTSLTTAAGFFALGVSRITQIKYFGIFVGIGALIAMVLSAVAVPALLLIFPGITRRKTTNPKQPREQKTGSFLKQATIFIINHARMIAAAVLLVALLCIYGIVTRLYVDYNPVLFFDENSQIVTSARLLNDKFSGSEILNLVITSSEEGDPMKKPRSLKIIDDLQKFLQKNPLVGKTFSLASLIKRTNYVMHQSDPRYNRVPHQEELVAVPGEQGERRTEKVPGYNLISQYLLLYEMSGGDILPDVVNGYSTTNIKVILRTNSSREIGMVMDSIRRYATENFPPYFSLEITGLSENNVAANREIVVGQTGSLIISYLVIFLLLVIIFKSLKWGILGLLPLTLTILVNFGFLSLIKKPLDNATALISCIVIGVGVDYSIHYLSRFRLELSRGHSYVEALVETIGHSGKAILFNALVVSIGFLTLSFSEFLPTKTVGWMVASTMLTCCLTTLIVIPAILTIGRGFSRQEIKNLTAQLKKADSQPQAHGGIPGVTPAGGNTAGNPGN